MGFKRNRHTQTGNFWLAALLIVAVFIAGILFLTQRKNAAKQQLAMQTAALEIQQRADDERKILAARVLKATAIDALAASLKSADDIYAKWEDARRIASSTGRIALSGPVSNLQSIKRDMEKLTVPACLDRGVKELLQGMTLIIDGYLSFMSNSEKLGELSAMLKFDEAKPHFGTYETDRKLCPSAEK